MKILQVSSARAFGGGERHFVDLTCGLVAREHEVHAVVRRESPLRESLSHLPGSQVHTLPLRNALDLPSAFGLARLARRIEAQIIHAHVARDYPLAAYAARQTGARLVITRHVLFPLSRAHRLTLSNVSRVIAVSGAVARALREQAIFPPDRIRVVLNGIDVARFATAQGESGSVAKTPASSQNLSSVPALRVGTVGSLVENKGHDVFLRAAAGVISRVSIDVEFVIIGDEGLRGGEYRQKLEALITELGLGRFVRLRAQWEDTASVLPTFDIFVSASRTEAFGLAMAEALASGVPVVATATDGAREIIEEGVNGLIVPIDNTAAIASALISLLENETLRADFAAHARESARRRFGLQRMIEETERVYLEATSYPTAVAEQC